MDPKDNTPQPGVTPEPGKEEGKDGGSPKSYSQEDIDKAVEARLAREREKSQKEVERARIEAREEAERLSKLSAEEKEKELINKQKQEYAEREQKLTLRENRAEAVEHFTKIGLDPQMVDFVVTSNKEAMLTNIEKLDSAFKTAVKRGVEEQLKGDPPKDLKSVSAQPTALKLTL